MQFRVAEIFGPTIQGEGRYAGVPCYFIRFGGCDYRCTWCDTPHAVLPDRVAELPKMDEEQIASAINDLFPGPAWIVLSGGNPLLLNLQSVIDRLREENFRFMVETQGTIWKPWLDSVDDICVSPKPPSAGKWTSPHTVEHFLRQCKSTPKPYLKVVVFNQEDYKYAKIMHQYFPEVDFYLSVGNDDPWLPTVGNPNPTPRGVGKKHEKVVETTREVVCNLYRHLAEKVAQDPAMKDVRVFPQLHVLSWGNERGR